MNVMNNGQETWNIENNDGSDCRRIREKNEVIVKQRGEITAKVGDDARNQYLGILHWIRSSSINTALHCFKSEGVITD